MDDPLAPGGVAVFNVTSGPGSVTVDHINAGTGLQSLTVVGAPVNATVTIPAFTPGTFNPVTVFYTRINPDLPFDFTLRAANSTQAVLIRVQCAAIPTAATVSISGRVTSITGRGIRNVRLTLTDSSGQTRTATTTSFGYYRFDDVRAGETYILSAVGKRFSFSQPTQVLNITGETDAINFIADSVKSIKVF